MVEYRVEYHPDSDDLVITRSAEPIRATAEELRTPGGLELVADSHRRRLVKLIVHRFSRQVDFAEIFEMFGPEMVRMLARMQAELKDTRSTVVRDLEPLRSRSLQRHLISA